MTVAAACALAAAAILAAFFALRRREPASAAKPGPAPAESEKAFLERRYALEGLLGQGSMGEIWGARDKATGREVAIKKQELEALGAQAVEYCLREARVVAELAHPAIVELYEVLQSDTRVYLVFEKLSGRTVQQILSASGPLSLEQARTILRPVCEALDFAHAKGVVHRDLKPGNIMVTDSGAVKIMDFGVARRVEEESAPKPGAVDWSVIFNGTPAYAAPETRRDVTRPVADVYSLGICLYEMLLGETPYLGHSHYLKRDRSYAKVRAKRRDIAPEIDALIYEALDPNPGTRLRSAGEFRARLDAARAQ